MTRTAFAFIKKDVLLTLSYRFDFFVQIFGTLFTVVMLSYVGKIVDSADIPFLNIYGGSYFGFIVIGLGFSGYINVSINTFFSNIREGQLTGTLEIILSSPTRLFTFLFSSSLWGYIFTTIRLSLFFLVGILAFEMEIGKLSLFPAIVVFSLSMIYAVGFGIIIASLVLVVKRGEGAMKFLVGISSIVSGLVVPTEIFPPLLQKISLFLPLTYTYRGLRLSILQGHSFTQLQSDIIALLFFAIVLMAISLITFPYAVKRAKDNGSLTQY
jgi:ABC-2 type transport system permease protein